MKPYEIILQQLGGNKFVAMTGAKLGREGDYTLIAKIKGSKAFNHIKIFLNGKDLYDITFMKIGTARTNFAIKNKEVFNDVYVEDMKNLIEQKTKLYLSL